jgi:crotonobetainyl-CoA:carnitine CoA-transferase CaiB-like acyl-CoA transferase
MCDQGCAVQSALAVLMALYWRERTGEGQLVDTSIVNAGVHFNTDAWIGPDGWSDRPRSDQQQAGLGPLYRLYPTSDGWVALACLGQSHWAALTKAVPGLDDARFEDAAKRAANADALTDVLAAFLVTLTADDAFELLDGAVSVEIADPDGGARGSTGLISCRRSGGRLRAPAVRRFRQFAT